MSHNINLLQGQDAAGRPLLTLRTVAAGAAAVAVLTGMLGGWLQFRLETLKDEATQAEAMRQQATSANDVREQKILKTVRELADLERLVEARLAALSDIRAGSLGETGGYSEHFRSLARSRIEGVWITGLSLERDEVTLRGKALDPQRVSSYLETLRREKLWAGHSFDVIEVKAPPPAPAAGPTGGTQAAPPALVEFTLSAGRASHDGKARVVTAQESR